MSCVYFGQEGLKHYADDIKSTGEANRVNKANFGFQQLIRVYLLADRLQDLVTTNVVIDEIMRFSDISGRIPCSDNFNHVYDHTTPHSPLRALMRDFWIYEMDEEYDQALDALPKDFMHDVLREFLRVKRDGKHATVKKAFNRDLRADTKANTCFYHQHNDKHRKCRLKLRSE
jgi:hypothetical protein